MDRKALHPRSDAFVRWIDPTGRDRIRRRHFIPGNPITRDRASDTGDSRRLGDVDRANLAWYIASLSRAHSSAGEHCLHTAGVGGSIPPAPTNKTRAHEEPAQSRFFCTCVGSAGHLEHKKPDTWPGPILRHVTPYLWRLQVSKSASVANSIHPPSTASIAVAPHSVTDLLDAAVLLCACESRAHAPCLLSLSPLVSSCILWSSCHLRRHSAGRC